VAAQRDPGQNRQRQRCHGDPDNGRPVNSQGDQGFSPDRQAYRYGKHALRGHHDRAHGSRRPDTAQCE
jgi:hypothetical protein